jgi:hypothetical protein
MVAICFVRRRDNHLPYRGASPTGLQERPGALNIRFKGRNWISVGNTDDRLSGDVENGINFVLAENSLQ